MTQLMEMVIEKIARLEQCELSVWQNTRLKLAKKSNRHGYYMHANDRLNRLIRELTKETE